MVKSPRCCSKPMHRKMVRLKRKRPPINTFVSFGYVCFECGREINDNKPLNEIIDEKLDKALKEFDMA